MSANRGRQCADRYRKHFLAVTQKPAKDLPTKIADCLRAKRAARVMLTVRTTHTDAKQTWLRLLIELLTLLEIASDRLAAFADLQPRDRHQASQEPRFRIYIYGTVECVRVCMDILASFREAGWSAEQESRALELCNDVWSQVISLGLDLEGPPPSMSSDGLITQAAEAMAAVDKPKHCNLTLRPLLRPRSSTVVGDAHYVYSIEKLWREMLGLQLPRTDCVFD